MKKIIFLILFLFISATGTYGAEEDDSKSFRFIVMGCLHYDGTNIEDLELAVETMKQYDPDFVLFLGSIVDTVGERRDKTHLRPNTSRAFREGVKLTQKDVKYLWGEFDRVTKTLGVPIYDVPSERTIPANNVNITEDAYLKRHPYRYYSFNYKNNLFILLDSEAHNRLDLRNRGIIDGDQLEFLKGEIKDYDRYDNVFIAMHKTSWGEGWERSSNWFEEVHPLINGKVEKVFGACAHYLSAEKKGDTEYITCGTAPDWPGEEKYPSFFYFLVVDVTKDAVLTHVVPITPIPLENIVPYPGVRKRSTSSASGQWKASALIKEVPARSISLGRPKNYDSSQLSYLKRADGGRSSRRKLERPERLKLLKIDEIVKRLGIKEGMTVVDIGAGSGIFAFPIAEAMNGTGMVYATETSEEAIGYIEEDIEKSGIKNVKPVLVTSKGLDPFYTKHDFDIILVADTYELIKNPNKYFRDLRKSLDEDTGRLFIIYYRFFSGFTPTEFSDMGRVVRTLSAEGENFPIYERLSKETKDRVLIETEYKVSERLKELLLEDLNAMLEDRTLFRQIDDYFAKKSSAENQRDYIFIGPTYFSLIDATVKRLKEEGVYDDPTVPMSEGQIQQLRRLNRIAITEVFKNNMIYDTFTYDRTTYVNKDEIIENMAVSGYKFVEEYDFLDYHYMFEFKRSK